MCVCVCVCVCVHFPQAGHSGSGANNTAFKQHNRTIVVAAKHFSFCPFSGGGGGGGGRRTGKIQQKFALFVHIHKATNPKVGLN